MNNYYCVLPFYSFETDFGNPQKNMYCCRLQPSTDINEVRKSIINHQKAKECSTCWELEDKGLRSERQIHNLTLDYLLDKNLETIEIQSLDQGYKPIIIKLATSNVCNGQCVTCNSNQSSAWAGLENKTNRYNSIDLEQLDQQIDWSNITSLSFVGGEPLLENKNFQILQRLIDIKNTNCFISIVTNGSIDFNEQKMKILQQFDKLNICLSIDGVNASFEYMRFPCKWNKMISNLQNFRNITDNISVSCMISNLNSYYYSDMIEFFKDEKLNYLCKQINFPAIFCPGNLPDTAKKIIVEKNKKYSEDISFFLQIGKYSPELYLNLKREILRQDSLKGISLKNYMPEVYDFL